MPETETPSSHPPPPPPLFLTTPIFYVNGPPHLGHLYTGLLADALSRTHRLRSRATHLLTGTDEHGNKVLRAASAQHLPPLAFATAQSQRYRDLFDASGVSYDAFIRTTDPHHARVVQRAWTSLASSGALYLGSHSGWYSTADEAFVPPSSTDDRDGRRVHAITGLPLEWQEEQNYMFRVAPFQPRLQQWLASTPCPIHPPARAAEVAVMLAQPLPDLSVSRLRANAPWGVEVPGDPSHTVYVWLDALLNYLTACIDPSSAQLPAAPPLRPSALWPPAVQVVGKDILKFHAVYWPAFLLALGLPLPRRVVAHGHWTVERRKMSKSLGNVVDPFALLEGLGVDATRWCLLSSTNYAEDSDWSESSMRLRYNSQLPFSLGNLLNRCLGLLEGRRLPERPSKEQLRSKDLGAPSLLHHMEEQVMAHFEEMEFAAGVEDVMVNVRYLNRYFDESRPWELKKQGKKAELDVVLYICLEGCRMAALLLQPIIPQGAGRMLDQLGVPRTERTLAHYQSAPLQSAHARTAAAVTPRLRDAFPSSLSALSYVCCARRISQVRPCVGAAARRVDGSVPYPPLDVGEECPCSSSPERCNMIDAQELEQSKRQKRLNHSGGG